MLFLAGATAFVLSPPPIRCSSRGARCAAADLFEEVLQSILLRVETAGPKAAVANVIGELNESFMPWLGERIEVAQDTEATELSQLKSVMQALQTIYPPASDVDPAVDEAKQARWAATDELLSSHWRSLDGTIDDEEEAYVDTYDSPPGSPRQLVFERPSAYGEVTRSGARRLFDTMGLHDAHHAVFADLGSGAGRLVAQAWIELPSLGRAVGVELAPSRHAAAVRAWKSVVGSGAVKPNGRLSDGPEFRPGSMLETDLSAVTHAYVASLCMNDALLDALWSRLRSSAPELQVAATLRPFPGESAAAALSHVALVEMSWNRKGGPGTEVFVYRF